MLNNCPECSELSVAIYKRKGYRLLRCVNKSCPYMRIIKDAC